MQLPNGDRADLGNKLEDYTLNTAHRDGRHKARLFTSVLGLSQENSEVLKSALLQAAAGSDQFEAKGDNGFGQIYVLRSSLTTAAGTATVTSAWIIRRGETFQDWSPAISFESMNGGIHLHDPVALLEDTPATHFETGEALRLRRGQVGTVVMTYDGKTFEVEFSGRDGRTYALVPVPAVRLMVLREVPELVAA
jgi:hypothetical protein